jgi:SAM-dependent methyltransferase
MDPRDVLRTNGRAYDSLAATDSPLCRPATESELANPLATVDGCGWLGSSINGKRVLCLAAGGGRQSSLYAAAGASVTVVDLSRAMLELDRRVAAERGYSLRLFETSMEDLSMLGDGEFDIVIHPVSSCYVPHVQPVFAEVARVTRPGGLYISQHKQPVSLQASVDPNSSGCYEIQHTYYRDEPLPACASTSRNAQRLREPGTIEFLHRWEQLSEPVHARRDASRGTFSDRAAYIAPYVRIKARRRGADPAAQSLWLPRSAKET